MNNGFCPAIPSRTSPEWLIVIAASAGGLSAIRTVLAALPSDFPAAIVVVLHRPPDHANHLRDVLARSTRLPVVAAEQGQAIEPGIVYLARPGFHLTVDARRRFVYSNGTRIKFLRSSANPLFESAADAFDGRTIGVVLSGTGSDATDGVQGIKKHGGMVIAQDSATAQHSGMPEAAAKAGAVDYVLPIGMIGPALEAIVHGGVVGDLGEMKCTS